MRKREEEERRGEEKRQLIANNNTKIPAPTRGFTVTTKDLTPWQGRHEVNF